MNSLKYDAIIIGGSAGALSALSVMLPYLPADFPVPIIVICHRLQASDDYLIEYLARICNMKVQSAENLEPIYPGIIYIAPAGYHLLFADDFTFNLAPDPPINFSRPSIDVSFESAAEVYAERIIGVILTGANRDGTEGLKKIKSVNGYTIVQDPKTAQVGTMPSAALEAVAVDYVGTLREIALHLCDIFR